MLIKVTATPFGHRKFYNFIPFIYSQNMVIKKFSVDKKKN